MDDLTAAYFRAARAIVATFDPPLTPLEWDDVCQLASLQARRHTSRVQLQTMPAVVTNAGGAPRTNPLVSELKVVESQIDLIVNRLFITRGTNEKIKARAAKAETPTEELDEFLSK